MKKTYLIPELEILELETSTFLAASDPGIPGDEGGENGGKEYTSDEGLDDILG